LEKWHVTSRHGRGAGEQHHCRVTGLFSFFCLALIAIAMMLRGGEGLDLAVD
jgi:hypothetical protein